MQGLTLALIVGLTACGVDASYPTACSAYGTCAGLQGDCCPNMQGVNLACCFSGALLMDAAAADKVAAEVSAKAKKETSSAEAAATEAKEEASKAAGKKEAADKVATEIQGQIDTLNKNADAAQKRSSQAAAQATNDATVAAKQAMAAEAAAKHAKKLEEEQSKIVTETSAVAASKKAIAATEKVKADKLNAIAGAATAKLNDAKKKAEEEAAAAALSEKAEDKVVASKNSEAAKIKAAAAKVVNEATAKKTAAEAMLKKIENAQCKKHTGCATLEGYCCPTLNTNTMHLGSTKLDGENLGCCNTAEEMVEMATRDPTGSFGIVSMLLAAAAGSVVTASAFKLSAGKKAATGPYERLNA